MESQAWGFTLAWILAVIAVIANIAGYAFSLYDLVWWFDRLLHAFTIFAMTFWLAIFLFGRALDVRHGHDVLGFFLLVSVGVAIGAIWEVAEWALNQIVPEDVIKGKHDTIIDIVMDTLGATLAAILALKALRPRGAELRVPRFSP